MQRHTTDKMHRLTIFLFLTILAIMAKAQNEIEITVGGKSMTATLADTEAATQLKSRLENEPITVRMNDYGGFEKVGELPWPLPASDTRTTTSAGDIMLYQGRNIVIFYGSNSWAYTPLGRIEGAGASEIRDFLAGSSVDVTISIKGETAIDDISADPGKEPMIVTLQGHRIDLGGRKLSDLPKGIYIINGKKHLIK